MLNLKELKEKRSHLQYDMDSIRQYLVDGNYDARLKETWNGYKLEMKELNHQIDLLSNPELQALEERRLALIDKIHGLEKEILVLQGELDLIEHEEEIRESEMHH